MLKSIVAVACWSGLCLGIWLLSLSAVSDPELGIGAACAVACAVAAVALRRAVGWRWSVRAIPWSAYPTMLLAVGSDAVQVLAKAVTRSSTGRVETVDVGARGHGADATARRVGAIMAMSATPGTIVLDADDDGRITFHSLGCKGPRVEDKVARR